MNERTFLQQVAADHDTVVELEAHVYATLSAYCDREGIPGDEISNDELRQLSHGIIERGLHK